MCDTIMIMMMEMITCIVFLSGRDEFILEYNHLSLFIDVSEQRLNTRSKEKTGNEEQTRCHTNSIDIHLELFELF